MSSYLEFGWLPGLLGLLLIPLIVWLRYIFGRSVVSIVPYVGSWGCSTQSASPRWRAAAMYGAIVLSIVAAARPQWIENREIEEAVGAEIVLAVDLSTSMYAEDYVGKDGPIDRLSALKPTLRQFIAARELDRFALVVFAGKAYTLVPMTSNVDWLIQQIDQLQVGMIEDGTAIGDGLGLALSQFQGTPSPGGRLVILVTDGANTSGSLTPPQATSVARYLEIPVYTVAAGRDGFAPYPLLDAEGRRIGTRQQPATVDRDSLRTIADRTGGRYFNGYDLADLASAFAAIDSSQGSTITTKVTTTSTELRAWFLAVAILLMATVLASLLWQWFRRAEHLPSILRGIVTEGQLQLETRRDETRWLPYATLIAVMAATLLAWPRQDDRSDSITPPKQLLIALDLSRSMDARDLLPSRLEHARRLALRLVDLAAEDLEIGLLVFAGKSFTAAPISRERDLLRRALQDLQTSDLLSQGTDFSALIELAQRSFAPTAVDRQLLVLSDGEAQLNTWQQQVPLLTAARVRTHAVMFGTTTTVPIPVGEAEWLRNPRGMFVYSSASAEALESLSSATNGAVWSAVEQSELLAPLSATIFGADPAKSTLADLDDRGGGDWRSYALLLLILMMVVALVREVPTVPRLTPALLLLVGSLFLTSHTIRPLLAETTGVRRALLGMQSAEERDALVEMQALVADLVVKPALAADDYQRLAETAINYGAIHRLHSHPLALGVLRDGLVAVAYGRALAPERSVWDEQASMLKRLLEPPPPAIADPGEFDPANEPLEGSIQMPSGAIFEPEDEMGSPRETEELSAGPRSLGGGALDVFDAREWGDPSVTIPLALVREIRRDDRLGDVFKALQQRSSGTLPAGAEQLW